MLTRFLLAVSSLPLLTGCMGFQLFMIAAEVGGRTSETDNGELIITGNTDTGAWYDHDVFYVNATSFNHDEIKPAAYNAATDACVKRGQTLKVIDYDDQARQDLLRPPSGGHYRRQYRLDFRCEIKSVEKPG